MRNVLILPFVILLSACAQTQVQPVDVTLEVQGLHLDAPNFLKLTAEDIGLLERATIDPINRRAHLSAGRDVVCNAHSCRWNDRRGTLVLTDIQRFKRTLTLAQVNRREERIV